MAIKKSNNTIYKDRVAPAVRDLIYLAACAVNETVPDPARVRSMELGALYNTAVEHQMVGITAIMLKRTGIEDSRFEEYFNKILLLDRIVDAERKKILTALEQAGIWYMLLKGAVIKDYYPEPGMRQMADNDILFDASRAYDVREIMSSLNYTVREYGERYHDDYWKPPVSHFEMHRMLYSASFDKELYQYYQNIEEKLTGSKYEKFLTQEDFYIFVIAHEYKHYYWTGIGLRALLDSYVMMKKYEEQLDWKYIQKELGKIGLDRLSDFERRNRLLAKKAFADGQLKELTEDEWEMLSFFAESGMCVTREHEIQNAIKRKGKVGYVLVKLFPPLEEVRENYPFFYQHKILIPGLFFYRLWKKRDAAIEEIKVLLGKRINEK